MIEINVEGTLSRRTFVAGAVTAGVGAFLAARVQQASAEPSSDPIKMVGALWRRPDLTPAQFYDYWLNQHGPYATEQIKVLGGYRYVQTHGLDSSINSVLAGMHGTGESYDGLVEVWFPSVQALITAMATPQGVLANQNLVNDEKNFMDAARCSLFLATEHVLLG